MDEYGHIRWGIGWGIDLVKLGSMCILQERFDINPKLGQSTRRTGLSGFTTPEYMY